MNISDSAALTAAIVATIGTLGAGVAWVIDHFLKHATDARDEMLRAKDERILAKDEEIARLKEQLKAPSDMLAQLEFMKAAHNEQRAALEQQLASATEQANRREIEGRIEQEKLHSEKLEGLSRELAQQNHTRMLLERENAVLKAKMEVLESQRGALTPGLGWRAEEARRQGVMQTIGRRMTKTPGGDILREMHAMGQGAIVRRIAKEPTNAREVFEGNFDS